MPRVKDMSAMFQEKTISFNRDISKWCVPRVKDMSAKDAISFDADVSRWNVSNVKDMTSMFTGS